MLRALIRALAIIVIVLIVVVVLEFAELLVPVRSSGTSSMAPAIPACDGLALAEGFTYKFRDPERGEIVAIHAAGRLGGEVTPDRDARDLVLTKRVAGVPGDEVVGREGTVFVNGVKFDDIRTDDFEAVSLGGDQYFVLGDNRTASLDSRQIGPILRNSIFARVFLVFWPLSDFGPPEARKSGLPPGPTLCN